jgi:hypothetical protein
MANKSIYVISILLAVLLVLSPGVAQSPSPVVSITISMKDTNIKAGSKIWVDVVTANQSDHAVGPGFYPGPLEGWDFSTRIELLDSRGKPVPLKPPDQSSCNGDPKCTVVYRSGGSFVPVTVDPGASFKDGFLISTLYDLSKPGTYTIQAFRKDKGTVQTDKSNVLTFTVIP